MKGPQAFVREAANLEPRVGATQVGVAGKIFAKLCARGLGCPDTLVESEHRARRVRPDRFQTLAGRG